MTDRITVQAPPSKSILQRMVLMSPFCKEPVHIKGVGNEPSTDVQDALAFAEAMDVRHVWGNDSLDLIPNLILADDHCTVQGSATTLRMGAALAMTECSGFTFEMGPTLAARSHKDLAAALEPFGVTVHQTGNRLELSGHLQSRKNVALPPMDTSQPISGLMMALPFVSGRSSFIVPPQTRSTGYLWTTAGTQWLMGLQRSTLEILPGNLGMLWRNWGVPVSQERTVSVPGDWSAAAFVIAASAITDLPVTITDMGAHPLRRIQPDSAVANVAGIAGCRVKEAGSSLEVTPSGSLNSFVVDCSDTPDLIPALAVLALYCPGITLIHGADRLRNKESDRAAALVSEITRCGGRIVCDGDLIRIEGGHPVVVPKEPLRAFDDHRIAMALLVMGLGAEGTVIVDNTECIRKSYPDFLDHLALFEEAR